MIPGFFALDIFKDMGALYAIGSLLSFMIAHASIIMLRISRPDMTRPFRIAGSIGIFNRDIPVTSVFGLLATTSIWVILLVTQPYSRWIGLGWMAIGLLIYLFMGWLKKRRGDEWVVKPGGG
jgi:APA family basic amino acid/polyamine antiporter